MTIIQIRYFLCGLLYLAAGYTSGQSKQTPPKAELAVADTVGLFGPGIISTPLNERDLAVSPDGSEIMYTLSTMDNSLRAIILVNVKEGKVMSKTIAPFSGQYNDIEPFYSPDGTKVYFASTRPLYKGDTTQDYNIWYTEKVNGSWNAEPKSVSNVINSDADEYFPAVAASGSIYFTAGYPTGFGREDIFWSAYINGTYGAPVPLDTMINSGKYEFNAYVSPKEDILVYSSYGRADDMGGGDLYISTKGDSGRWSQARNAGPEINSNKLDYCPFIDLKNNNFYFTSNRIAPMSGTLSLQTLESVAESILNGMGNIFAVRLDALKLN